MRIEERGSEKPIGLTEQLSIEFKKEDCVLVAIKFDTEITTVVNKCKVASILSPFVQVRKRKLEKRNTHHG